MLSWASDKHTRRVEKEKVRRESRAEIKGKGRGTRQSREAVAGVRKVVSARGAMNVVGPTFTAVSKSPTVGRGRGPESQVG